MSTVAFGVDFGSSSIVVSPCVIVKNKTTLKYCHVQKDRIFFSPIDGKSYFGDYADFVMSDLKKDSKYKDSVEGNLIYSYKRFLLAKFGDQGELDAYCKKHRLTYNMKLDDIYNSKQLSFYVTVNNREKIVTLQELLKIVYGEIFKMIRDVLEKDLGNIEGGISNICVCYTRSILLGEPDREFVEMTRRSLEDYIRANPGKFQSNTKVLFSSNYGPVTALHKYVRSNEKELKEFTHFVMFDYGACTLDIALISRDKSASRFNFDVRYARGEISGGDTFDMLLADKIHELKKIGLTLPEAKDLKEKLSVSEDNSININESVSITKGDLNDAVRQEISNRVDTLLELLRRFYDERGASGEKILVCVSGGAPLVPCARSIIEEKVKSEFKDVVVKYGFDNGSIGKAYQSYGETKHRKVYLDVARGAGMIASREPVLSTEAYDVEVTGGPILFREGSNIRIVKSGGLWVSGIENGVYSPSERRRISCTSDTQLYIKIGQDSK